MQTNGFLPYCFFIILPGLLLLFWFWLTVYCFYIFGLPFIALVIIPEWDQVRVETARQGQVGVGRSGAWVCTAPELGHDGTAGWVGDSVQKPACQKSTTQPKCFKGFTRSTHHAHVCRGDRGQAPRNSAEPI